MDQDSEREDCRPSLTQGRKQWLDAFLDPLSRTELRYVQERVSQRFDPLHILPTDLVCVIFCMLPVVDVWRLRCVCTNWHESLCQPFIVRAALARTRTYEPSDSAHSTVESDDAELDNRTDLFKRHFLSKPASYKYVEDAFAYDDTGFNFAPGAFALKGRFLAYLKGRAGEAVSLEVRDLVTGDTTTLRGDAREKLGRLALTETLIAFVTHTGFLYTAEIGALDTSKRRIRLPSSHIYAMAAKENHVALILAASGEKKRTLCVFDRQSDKSHSFAFFPRDSSTLSTGSDTFEPHGLLVDPISRHVDVFSRLDVPESDGKIVLLHKRFSFTGVGRRRSAFLEVDLGDLVCSPMNPRAIVIGDVRPTGLSGRYHLLLGTPSQALGIVVLFNAINGRFAPPLQVPPYITAIWKDRVFQYEWNSGLVSWRLDGNISKGLKRHRVRISLPGDQFLMRTSKDCPHAFQSVLVNDSFLVAHSISTSSFHVLCYDQSIHMMGGEEYAARDTYMLDYILR